MQRGTWIILETTSGGELAREFVPFEDGIPADDPHYQLQLKNGFLSLTSCGINDGDIIRYVEGESEIA